MNHVLNGNTVIRHFKHSNVIEIRNGITFDFYTGLPHIATQLNTHLVSQERGRIYMVTPQPLSCYQGRNLLWPMRSALFVHTCSIHCHGVTCLANVTILLSNHAVQSLRSSATLTCSVTRPSLYLQRVWLARLIDTGAEKREERYRGEEERIQNEEEE